MKIAKNSCLIRRKMWKSFVKYWKHAKMEMKNDDMICLMRATLSVLCNG